MRCLGSICNSLGSISPGLDVTLVVLVGFVDQLFILRGVRRALRAIALEGGEEGTGQLIVGLGTTMHATYVVNALVVREVVVVDEGLNSYWVGGWTFTWWMRRLLRGIWGVCVRQLSGCRRGR